MGKKCPPGVICIENATILFFVSMFVIAGIYLYYYSDLLRSWSQTKTAHSTPQRIIINEKINTPITLRNQLFNPFNAPTKPVYFPPRFNDYRGGVPINIRTRGYDANYKQVGILTRINGPETILPLMGRPLHANRNKWQYYTLSDKNNSVQLPLSVNGRSCTQTLGCDEVYNSDTVYVEGYNDAFSVTIYDTATTRYMTEIPYL